jgi:hypothetical protein
MATDITGLPVGSVSLSGNDITVSRLLEQPRVIDRQLATVLNDIYWADKILPNVGTTSGGVIISAQWNASMALLDSKAELLAPDAEVPLAGADVGEPVVARANFRGLGFTVTDEQKLRNQMFVVQRKQIGLANEMADVFNSAAISVVLKAITDFSRTQPVPEQWDAVVIEPVVGITPSTQMPLYTIQSILATQRVNRDPFKFSTLVASPLDLLELQRIYPRDTSIKVNEPSRSDALGLDLIPDTTGLVTLGSPILVAPEGAGGTAWEAPISTEVVPERRRRRDVVQSTGSAAYFIDNPNGVLQLTGTNT